MGFAKNMPKLSLDEFLKYLQRSRLFSETQYDDLRRKLEQKSSSPEQLAERLVRKDLLTRWQARQLLKGNSGFVLENYRLLNPVGRGGMGHVFRALDSSTGKTVAVKVMARALTSNETLVSRFRREIRASRQLHNPHVVQTLDAGRVGKVDFMVMEYVNGEQVDRIANDLVRVPSGIACEIVRQIAIGLQHASEHGMVHRDIKPANMMLHWNKEGIGTAKLMDMGLVMLTTDSPDQETVTRAGQVMGTPDYMSPEQGWDTSQVDIRSDIYSLGCSLFRMLTGTIPFSGTNPLQVLSQRLQRDAPEVKSVCDDIPEQLSDVVARMTRRDPDSRFQQPQQIADALIPFCCPIDRSAIQDAPRSTPASAATIPDSGEVDETDATYKQFLREVEDGSEVDLLIADTEPGMATKQTVPILGLGAKLPSPTTRKPQKRSRRTTRLGIKALIVGAVALAGLAIVVGLISQGGGSGGEEKEAVVEGGDAVEAGGNETQPAVTGSIDPGTPPMARTGEEWKHKITASVEPPQTAVEWRVGSSAPVGVQIDSKSGELTWALRSDQSPSRYMIPVELYPAGAGEDDEPIALSTVEVDVQARLMDLISPEPSTHELHPDQLVRLDLLTERPTLRSESLQFELINRFPPGLRLLPDGFVQWTPVRREIGRHNVTVRITKSGDPTQTALRTLRLMVIPSKIEHVMPALGPIEATPGEVLTISLPTMPVRPRLGVPAVTRVISIGPGGPAGVSVNGNELRWNVPTDAEGSVTIPLTAEMFVRDSGRKVPLSGVYKQVVNIKGKASAATMQPPASEVAAARKAIEETYDRALSQARSAQQRAELAARLIDVSRRNEPGAEDFALLELIDTELATRSRAADVLFEIGRLRGERYGIDELESARTTLKSFRKSSLDERQDDIVNEQATLLAIKATAEADFKLANELIKVASLTFGRATNDFGRSFVGDLAAAGKLATKLSSDPDNSAQVEELNTLLNRWKFQPLFADGGQRSFVQLTPAGASSVLADSGRSLWSGNNKRLAMISDTHPVQVGILDGAEVPGNSVIRFNVQENTNCLQLLIGANGDNDNFNALRIILDESAFGQMSLLKPPTALLAANQIRRPPLYSDRSTMVEITITDGNVAVRVNGAPVSRTRVDIDLTGKFGVIANLQQASPKLTVSNLRVLRMPK